MADILIRGMEMPTDNNATSITIFSNGKVSLENEKKYAEYAEAVPLPAGHGRLIDADALLNNNGVGTQIAGWGKMFHETAIAYAPTIVPAEGGGEE